MRLLVSQIIFFGCCLICIKAIPYDSDKNILLPSPATCGYQFEATSSSGETNLKEFPWLVYIPLETRTYNPQANIRCAGVLISKRYVVFNKHCLQFVLTKVQLGRHDTSQNVTCVEDVCTNPFVEIDVESKVVDESLEVVLLRLAKDVTFTEFISPICLPWENFDRATTGSTLFTSGWGMTNIDESFSKTKKKVSGELLDTDACVKTDIYINVKEINRLCVKTKEDSPNKACNGDEGSPIMYNSNGQWILEGILLSVFESLDTPCSINVPSLGFKITEDVLTWISENVKE